MNDSLNLTTALQKISDKHSEHECSEDILDRDCFIIITGECGRRGLCSECGYRRFPCPTREMADKALNSVVEGNQPNA